MKEKVESKKSAPREEKIDEPEEIKEEEHEEADPQLELQKQIEEERKSKLDLEAKYKNLSGMLTKTQQEYAELLKFQKAILPKLNKTFEETWNEDPQTAVKQEVEKVKSEVTNSANTIQQQIAYSNAIAWMNQVVAEEPEKAKYIKKVKELGTSMYGNLTYSEEGIRELFDIAEAKDYKENRAKEVKEDTKSRTYTESGGTGRTSPNSKRPLNPQEKYIAKSLGITEDQYRFHKDNGTANSRAKEIE